MDQLRYKRRLVDLERDLVARMARGAELGREQTNQGVGDFGDAGVAEEDASADFVNVELDSTVLRQVQGALRRIEAGTFGLCVVDGRPIDARRLAASPWVPFCLEHETLFEADARHRFPTM